MFQAMTHRLTAIESTIVLQTFASLHQRCKYRILLALTAGAVLLCYSFTVSAQIQFGPAATPKKGEVLVRELNSLNENFLNKQRQTAEDLVRFKLGRQLHQNQGDLKVMQSAIDRGHLDDADKETLQAFGAAMGDVFVSAHKNLNWKVYEDDLGASHAVCLDQTKHCIFPMTLISRRMEKGLKPNTTKIFNEILATFKPYFPKLPYSREQ